MLERGPTMTFQLTSNVAAIVHGPAWQIFVMVTVIGAVVFGGQQYARRHPPRRMLGPSYGGPAQIDGIRTKKEVPIVAAALKHVHRPQSLLTGDILSGYLSIDDELITWVPGRWATIIGAKSLAIPTQSVTTVIFREKMPMLGDTPVIFEGEGFRLFVLVGEKRTFHDAARTVPSLFPVCRWNGGNTRT